MSSTDTIALTDRALVDSLRSVPSDILPVGILRELMQRGPSIQDELLRRLDAAVEAAGTGIGSIPAECFYCLGLLTAHPCLNQLPTLERLLRLEHDLLETIGSELAFHVPRALIVELAREDRTEVIGWLDRMLQDESIGEWSYGQLLEALSYLVRDGHLERNEATDRIVSVLRRREHCEYDLISAIAITELGRLGATECDTYVHECFDRQQIGDDYYARSDWVADCEKAKTPNSRLEQLDDNERDLVKRLERWYCFSEVSHSLDPFVETTESNPAYRNEPTDSTFTTAEIDAHFEALRSSNDHRFPRAAIKNLRRNAQQVKERLIDVVCEGLEQAGGPAARANNGPFLALVLLIAADVRIPRDVLLRIIDLSDDQRMELFGEAIYPAVVVALSRSLRGDTGPIDARILDSERSEADRVELARFYPLSSWLGHLTRDDAIDGLFRTWKSTFGRENGQSLMISDSLMEALCVMSPRQHVDTLLNAIESCSRADSTRKQLLRGLLEDPNQGVSEVHAWFNEVRDPMKLIEPSCMFDHQALHPEKVAPKVAAPDLSPKEQTITIRNGESPPSRNDPCHCGSGKKYKKCCLRR